MEMNDAALQFNLAVSHAAHIDAARRAAVNLARDAGAGQPLLDRLTLVIQEMARNLVLHAHGGEMLYFQNERCLQLLAVDRGPGMQDVARCLSDSFSTAGTMGAGLGAIKRLADTFDLYSQPGQGTVVFAGFDLQAPSAPLTVAGLSTPYPGEESCGDSWACKGHRLMVCDGLGHGHAASLASSRAREIFLQHDLNLPQETLLERMHHALASTRGGAVALAEVLPQQCEVRFCAMGNILGVLDDGRSRSMVSGNGTVGYRIGRIKSFSYPWSPSTVLLMASDGIGSRFDLGAYPGLATRHPAVIAGVLHRDFRRHNDDATLVVLKHV